jgi:hypothetical protein
MITSKTTIAELEAVLLAFGLYLEVQIAPLDSVPGFIATISDRDYTERANAPTIDVAINAAIEQWKIARTLGNAAVTR